MWLLKFVTK